MGKRKNPTPNQRTRLLEKNAYRCCVCKQRGIGLHLHHIDGDSSNTVDENIAVLCVQDHDLHHRPSSYEQVKHLELDTVKLYEYKNSWECFVQAAQQENPSIVATVNVYGTFDSIHSAKLIMQWANGKIEYERIFHLLEGDIDYWTNEMLAEIYSIGKNIPLAMISEPLPVEYCPCCNHSISHTVSEDFLVRLTDERWAEDSVCSIYINPDRPSLFVLISLLGKHVFECSLHLCQGQYLHFTGSFEERIKIKRASSVRGQVAELIKKMIADWEPSHIFIGTGDPNMPHLIHEFVLPDFWEG